MNPEKPVLFSTLFLILAAGFLTISQAKKGEPRVHFAIIGDRTGGHVLGVYEQAVSEIERLRPDFVMTVGDAIEGYTSDTAELESQWTEFKSIIAPLSAPIHLTPGNHDITTDSALTTFEREAGKPYYSFDYKGLHLIVLDNSRWESSDKLPGTELSWLESDLRKNKNARYTLVFFHKPFWYESLTLGKPDTLHNLFHTYGVDAVFNGHYHVYLSEKIDGILYTAVGSSGGEAEPGPTGLGYHFTWVTVDDQGISIAPIRLGSVLGWDELRAQDIRNMDNFASSGVRFEGPIRVNEDLGLVDTRAVLVIKNPSGAMGIDDTLRWKTTGGWLVEPSALALKMAPGESDTFTFNLKSNGSIYPAPAVSFSFPYREGRSYPLEKSLVLSRRVQAEEAASAPVIDGTLTDEAWKNPVTRLFAPDGKPSGTDSTRFWFSYDKDNLYLAAYCKESKTDSLAARVTARDGEIYREDCVGYFLSPDTGVIYQIYINPLGAVFDQRITVSGGSADADPSWNGDYEVKTMKGRDYWSMEARIPLSELGTLFESGSKLGLNFRRKQARLSTSADWMVPISYDPKRYGVLELR